MKEYFKDEIKKNEPLSEEKIESLKQNRIFNGLDTTSLEHLVPGDKFLYCMIEKQIDDAHINLEIIKILERELDTFCEEHEFVRESYSLNIFKRKE